MALPSEEDIRDRFCAADQGHLFRFWDELDSDGRSSLIRQLAAIDLDLLQRLVEVHLAGPKSTRTPAIEPGAVLPVPSSPEEWEDTQVSREAGEESLREGRVAMLLVAGGHMGDVASKGLVLITPVTHKPLFALIAQKVLAVRRRYGCSVPLLTLVAPSNHAAIQRFFEQNQYFGLDPEDVIFLEQGMLPAVDRDGRLLLTERGRVFLSPDGHGGVFRALLRSGILDQLDERGIESVFYFQVDNPLVKVGDPVFVGHHLRSDADFSLKVVRKRSAEERVGVYSIVDGRPGIIEYSDLTDDQKSLEDDRGELKLWAGSVGIHLFRSSFLRQIASGEYSLPYHMSRRQVPYVDDRGERVQPSEENSVRFESFVFDALPFASKVVAMEVVREEEFAPVKRMEGEDSAATAVRAQSALYRAWLAAAGIPVADEEARVEIGPLFALDKEELVRKIRKDGLLGSRTVLLD